MNNMFLTRIPSRTELKEGWSDVYGQGNARARERDTWCVVVPCEAEEQALTLSALFCRMFLMPSCCHWDGKTLSLNCHEAGYDADAMMRHLTQMLVGMGYIPDPATGYPLFGEEVATS